LKRFRSFARLSKNVWRLIINIKSSLSQVRMLKEIPMKRKRTRKTMSHSIRTTRAKRVKEGTRKVVKVREEKKTK